MWGEIPPGAGRLHEGDFFQMLSWYLKSIYSDDLINQTAKLKHMDVSVFVNL